MGPAPPAQRAPVRISHMNKRYPKKTRECPDHTLIQDIKYINSVKNAHDHHYQPSRRQI